MNAQTASEPLPPHATLIQMGTAFWVSFIVLAAARIQLADVIGDGSMTGAELADKLGFNASACHRFMRSLAGLGLLTEVESGRFKLTELGEALKKDAPGSAYASIMILTGDIGQGALTELVYSLETGKTGIEKSFGKPLFDYLAERPEETSLFSETMVGFHGAEPAAVAAAYDFSQFGSIVDIGGATGNMLAHILEQHESPRGVLFDLPHVVTDAPELIDAHGLSERISIESGSFFETVPVGHDAYILSHIIHDWDPDQCATILGHCRKAINPGGKLLIVEMVLPEGDVPHPGKILDMLMLCGAGGQERTPSEYKALLEPVGFELRQVVPTNSAVSIVEAVPV